jgi:hypothetical protein
MLSSCNRVVFKGGGISAEVAGGVDISGFPFSYNIWHFLSILTVISVFFLDLFSSHVFYSFATLVFVLSLFLFLLSFRLIFLLVICWTKCCDKAVRGITYSQDNSQQFICALYLSKCLILIQLSWRLVCTVQCHSYYPVDILYICIYVCLNTRLNGWKEQHVFGICKYTVVFLVSRLSWSLDKYK